MAKVITVICILVWLVNIRHFWDPSHHGALKGAIYYFKIAVALAVAAIPEGLAAVITACLALGTKKMAQKNAIVRHLPSVETLGCTNVICSDKTGTLTTNQMSVSRVSLCCSLLKPHLINLFSSSWSSTAILVPLASLRWKAQPSRLLGRFTLLMAKRPLLNSSQTPSNALRRSALYVMTPKLSITRCAYFCLAIHHVTDGFLSQQEKDTYSNVGEPTEAALRVLAEKIGCCDAEITKSLRDLPLSARANAVNEYFERTKPRLLTFEFSRDRKMMSVLVRLNGTGALFVKGAPESVLDQCTSVLVDGKTLPLTPALKATLLERTINYGSNGLRTLALAYRDVQDIDSTHYLTDSSKDYARFEQNLTFVSLVGMLDPPRPEVRSAIANCRTAGIRVICITGDNKRTAETICRRIGIFGEDEDLTGKSYTGRELDALSHEEQVAAVQRASLFSRTEPGHKSQLVDLLQGLGLVVAMVNILRSLLRFLLKDVIPL